jgi:hypothetical protein
MSTSDRLIRGAIVTAIIATAAIASLGGWWLWSQKLNYNNDRDYLPSQYASETKNICIKIPPAILFCPDEQNSSIADAHRSDNDLNAQREMADWAFVMAAVSAAGFLLSTIGIGLIYVTFRATRSAADAANDANRPWVEIVITEKRAFYIKPTMARVAFYVSLTNRGKSPAMSVRPRAVLVAVPESDSHQYVAITRLERDMEDWEINRPDSGSTIFPGVEQKRIRIGGNISRKELNKAVGGPDNKARFWVAVGVSYRFGNKWCRSTQSYLLKFPRRSEMRKVSEAIELKPEEFTINPMGQDYAT